MCELTTCFRNLNLVKLNRNFRFSAKFTCQRQILASHLWFLHPKAKCLRFIFNPNSESIRCFFRWFSLDKFQFHQSSKSLKKRTATVLKPKKYRHSPQITMVSSQLLKKDKKYKPKVRNYDAKTGSVTNSSDEDAAFLDKANDLNSEPSENVPYKIRLVKKNILAFCLMHWYMVVGFNHFLRMDSYKVIYIREFFRKFVFLCWRMISIRRRPWLRTFYDS